jgi:hypothetical protein
MAFSSGLRARLQPIVRARLPVFSSRARVRVRHIHVDATRFLLVHILIVGRTYLLRSGQLAIFRLMVVPLVLSFRLGTSATKH